MTDQLVLFDRGPVPEDPRDCWEIPASLYELLDNEFEFNADAAATAENNKAALCFRDGLAADWESMSVFINPPFSDIGTWVDKAYRACLLGAHAVMLLPANRTEQPWFQKGVIGRASEVRFLSPRVNYVPAPGIKDSGVAFPSMVVVFPRNPVLDTVVKGWRWK